MFDNIKNYVINERYANQISGQICESVVAQIKYKLSCAEISKKNESETRSTLESTFSKINYDEIKIEETKFQNALMENDYKSVIRVFNNCQTIINLLNSSTIVLYAN